MHPYGGTPICPRCSKAVYAAEQVMGPGRKLYHKPCLACTICNKRLDSFTLLEHDQQPYCKSCHVKNFGTRDLRQANLPHREASPSPVRESTSPVRNGFPPIRTPPRSRTPPRDDDVFEERSPSPGAQSHRESPTPYSNAYRPSSPPHNDTPNRFPVSHSGTGTPTNSGRGANGLPRTVTVPLSPTRTGQQQQHRTAHSVDSTPLKSVTGTRYGVALTGGGGGVAPVSVSPFPPSPSPVKPNLTGSPNKKWGMGTTPTCPKCGKSVYFAEQVKAIGKTWHKGCLRCTECKTALDSGRLTEKDGDPLCHRCYGKLYGPQGSGYALLGKAGG